MSLKEELETWSSALKLYDDQDLAGAIATFDRIADTSKINWNIGIILATMGEHAAAVERFETATGMDTYFTLAYQQAGVSNFMLGRYDAAHKNFEDALLYMRGNQTINYEQLGLPFRLYSAEILFNCGLTKIYLGQTEAGLADLREAATQKEIKDHEVIDDAIRDQGRDYNVFSVPVGILFKPAEGKLKNLKARDYMGKAILVAASDASDAYTTFTGLTRLQRGQTPTGAPLALNHPISRSASLSAIPTPGDPTPIANRMSRSKTVAAPGTTVPYASPRPLQRSVTTLPVKPSTMRSFTPTPAPVSVSESVPTLQVEIPRSRTASPSLGLLRDTPTPPGDTLKTPPSRKQDLRITELYDDYYKSPGAMDDDIPDLPPIGGAKKIAMWQKTVMDPPGGMIQRGGSLRVQAGYGNGGMLRRIPSKAESRGSVYDEEGEYDMIKIRVKVHVGALTRGMSVLPSQTYTDFISALQTKFPELASSGGIDVRFKDEDGDMLSMQDEGDFEAAVDVARVMAKGRAEGKLEIWVD